MKLTIEIKTGNAAFEDNPDELARLLNKATAMVLPHEDDPSEHNLRDFNGNVVGKVTVREDNGR